MIGEREGGVGAHQLRGLNDARQRGRLRGKGVWPASVADVLADTIGLSLQPLGAQHAADQPVARLSDADVLAIADSQMDLTQDQHMSELLDKQQAARLADEERLMLLALMQVYQDGLLRKALNEAVRRGLRSSLDP